MQKDIHYYAVYKIAEQVGFSPEMAYKLAFSSQFVDDCNNFIVEKERVKHLIGLKLLETEFRPIITQTEISIDALDTNMQRYVILPFHFLPGDDDGIVKANSINALGLINLAIMSENIYSLGIALHTYMDTWSHQGFTGFEDNINQVINWKTAYRYIVPNVGHADIGDDCDAVERTWFDYRKPKGNRKVVNKERFYDALTCLYGILQSSLEKKLIREYISPEDVKWDEYKNEWKDWLDIEDYEDRISNINVDNYDKDNLDFHEKGFYEFQRAAKMQVAAVFSNLNV